ncbi:MAG: HD domain-containing protein [Candidatus Competibacteraceae bacterium]|nr:HD domain-containing protein [Candidatus Competibacteraceae bacterium]MBK8898873.1 HD domain-containing protein [Candidatus Competibacteraceae bacterium]
MDVTIDLGQTIHALSDVLDFAGVDRGFHGKRVAIMAWHCGRVLGLNEAETEDLYYAALLHDCGMSSPNVDGRLRHPLGWEHDEGHCLKGEALLGQFAPLAHLAPIVRHHHGRWDALRTMDIPEPIGRSANLIYLVDRVDVLTSAHQERDPLLARHAVRDAIWQLSRSFFSQELVTPFLDISDNEAFWLSLEERHLNRFLFERNQKPWVKPIRFAELRQLALIFVRIVDAKSPLTMQHSLGTARLARFLAYKAGLSKEVQDKMEVAGLLHDLGKLRVPNEILEKPGKLNREERSLIERHSFETYKILSGIKGLEDITLWAACHHETPDGQGYPFRLAGEDLTLEMRIIAVSDVFQALAQRRPYRPSLSAAEVLEMLRGFVGQRRLDGAVVEMIGHDLEQTWALATGSNLKAEFAGGDGSNPVETPDGPALPVDR